MSAAGWRRTTSPDPRVQAAASDPHALEQLLRSAFRHAARYYLEVARTPGLALTRLQDRVVIETPDTVAEAIATGRVIFVGLHFGAIELPAMYIAQQSSFTVTVPMETIDDPGLQAWFERTRGATGVHLVDARRARSELLTALRDGRPVGLVGDRDLTGGGIDVEFFGAPAKLPAGPGLLAVETGAPVYATAVRRTNDGRYRGRVDRIPVPETGSRRERVTGYLQNEARAYERIIATAPDQWWAIFFPIWPDLVVRDGSKAPARRAGAAMTARLGRADLHLHTLASDGTAGIAEILGTWRTTTTLDVIAITDHERIDAAVAARAMAQDHGLGFEVDRR